MIHRTIHAPGSTPSGHREGIKTATSSQVSAHWRNRECPDPMTVSFAPERTRAPAAGPNGHPGLNGGQKAVFLLPGGRNRVAPGVKNPYQRVPKSRLTPFHEY